MSQGATRARESASKLTHMTVGKLQVLVTWESTLGCLIIWQLTSPSTREAQRERREKERRKVEGSGRERKGEEGEKKG